MRGKGVRHHRRAVITEYRGTAEYVGCLSGVARCIHDSRTRELTLALYCSTVVFDVGCLWVGPGGGMGEL